MRPTAHFVEMLPVLSAPSNSGFLYKNTHKLFPFELVLHGLMQCLGIRHKGDEEKDF